MKKELSLSNDETKSGLGVKTSKINKILSIAFTLVLAISTVPFALSMIPMGFWPIYIIFKIWLFGGVPLICLYIIKEDDKKTS